MFADMSELGERQPWKEIRRNSRECGVTDKT